MTKEYIKVYDDLHIRSKSLNKATRTEAMREYDIVRKCCYSDKYLFFKNNKHRGKPMVNSFLLVKGQLVTTYNELAKLWVCTYAQSRSQIRTWVKKGLIEKMNIKDGANKDLGFIITYKPLHKKVKVSSTGETTPEKAQLEGAKKIKNTPHKHSLLTKVNKKKTNKKSFVVSSVSSPKISKYSFEENKSFEEIANFLLDLKLSKKIIEKLYKNYSQTQIKAHIEHLRYQMKKGKVNYPKGFFLASMKDNFDLSSSIKHRAELEEEKKKQEEIKEWLKVQTEEKNKQKQIEREIQKIENKKLAQAVRENPSLIESILNKSSQNKLLKGKKIAIQELLNPQKLEHFVFVDFVKKELELID